MEPHDQSARYVRAALLVLALCWTAEGSVYEFSSPIDLRRIPTKANRVTIFFKIKTIYAGDLTHLKACSELSFINTSTTRITKGAFEGMSALKKLVISGAPSNLVSGYFHNNLTYLLKGMFTGLGVLAELDLSANQILYIESSTFQGLVALDTLSLHHNKLQTLYFDVFDPVMSSKYSGKALGFHSLESLSTKCDKRFPLINLPYLAKAAFGFCF